MQKNAKFLNQNFDSKMKSIILFSKPLADWFARNQETMVYFGLTKPGCLQFEETTIHSDVIVLGRMSNAVLTWLMIDDKEYTEEQKAFNAAMSIAAIYEQEESRLSDTAKELYAIHIEELKKEETNPKVRYKYNDYR